MLLAEHGPSFMDVWILAVAAPVTLGLGLGFFVWKGRRRREAALRALLDRADAVQGLLAEASRQMSAWRGTVGRLAGDLGSGAQQALEGEPLIREAKRDLLQHRLWIQQRGMDASQKELGEALNTLQRVEDRLSAQLRALQSAGDALTQATDAAHEAARREPPSLRRPADEPGTAS